MANQESGVPGGWGAKKGEGGGRVIEPYVPPTVTSGGTYTDAQGRPITQTQAQQQGTIDKPGEAGAKAAMVGASGGSQPAPIGLEALKQAEQSRQPGGLEAVKQREISLAQSRAGTTREEAGFIASMLRSPTSSITQHGIERGYAVVQPHYPTFKPEEIAPKYTTDAEFNRAYPGFSTTAYYPAARIDEYQRAYTGSQKKVNELMGGSYMWPNNQMPSSIGDYEAWRKSLRTVKGAVGAGIETTPETLYRGATLAAYKSGIVNTMKTYPRYGILGSGILSAYKLNYDKQTRQNIKYAQRQYEESIYARHMEFKQLPTSYKPVDIFLQHPATALIPTGAAWKATAFGAKYALGRLAYTLPLAEKTKTFGKVAIPYYKNPFLLAAKHGEKAAGAYFITQAYRGTRTAEEFIGKTAAIGAQLPGFRVGERTAAYSAISAGKATGIVPERFVPETQIPYQSRTQILEKLINDKIVSTVTATSGKGRGFVRIREPSPLSEGGVSTGVPGMYGAVEIGGTYRYGKYFTSKYEIGAYGLQRNVDVMHTRTSEAGKAIERQVLENIAANKEVKHLAPEYYRLVQEEATRLNEPIAAIPPKTFAKTAQAESEVFIVFPKLKTQKVPRFVSILGLKGAESENRIPITSIRLGGLTTEGATIRQISFRKQQKATGNLIKTLHENVKFNIKNITGKEWLKKESVIANRKILEESGYAPMVPGTYGKHGIQHARNVKINMDKWNTLKENEKIAAAMYHDITKISDESSSGETPFKHAQASARLIREGKLNVPELTSLSTKERMNVAKAIEQHTDIKPFTASALMQDSLNVFKTALNRPTTLSKALATADRTDLTRFGAQVKKGLIWTPPTQIPQTKQARQNKNNLPVINIQDKIKTTSEGYKQLTSKEYGYKIEKYNPAGYKEKGYPQIGYKPAGYRQQGYKQPSYAEPGYVQKSYKTLGYSEKGYNKPYEILPYGKPYTFKGYGEKYTDKTYGGTYTGITEYPPYKPPIEPPIRLHKFTVKGKTKKRKSKTKYSPYITRAGGYTRKYLTSVLSGTPASKALKEMTKEIGWGHKYLMPRPAKQASMEFAKFVGTKRKTRKKTKKSKK